MLYVYELQVGASCRRLGLGEHLMKILELVALQFDMTKLMLTVFKNNHGAMGFYRSKLGYDIDENSPSKFGNADESYEILSFPLIGVPEEAVAKEARMAAICADIIIAAEGLHRKSGGSSGGGVALKRCEAAPCHGDGDPKLEAGEGAKRQTADQPLVAPSPLSPAREGQPAPPCPPNDACGSAVVDAATPVV